MGGMWSKSINVDQYFHQGVLHFKNGEYQHAIEQFTNYIRLCPKQHQGYYNRAMSYSYLDNSDNALMDVNTAISLDNTYALAFKLRADIYYEQGNHDRARADINKAIRLNPNYVSALYSRGAMYAKNGDLELSNADFKRLIVLAPRLAEAYYYLSANYLAQNDYVNANEQLHKATLLSPPAVEILIYRSNIYHSQGDCINALADLHEVMRIIPKFALIYYKAAEIYLKISKIPQALEHYVKAFKLDKALAQLIEKEQLIEWYASHPQLYTRLKPFFLYSQRLSACDPNDESTELSEYLDPLSYVLMNDPITFSTTGHTYDRETIKSWFISTGNPEQVTCPLSRIVIPYIEFQQAASNVLLKKLIERQLEQLEKKNQPCADVADMSEGEAEQQYDEQAKSPLAATNTPPILSDTDEERQSRDRVSCRAMIASRIPHLTQLDSDESQQRVYDLL